jgi:ribosomal protein L37AE/L43A
MATVADWPDCARCKRPMTMVDSRERADGPVWRCLKCPTPDERGKLRSAEDRLPQRRS